PEDTLASPDPVGTLEAAKRGQVPDLVAGWPDRLDPTGRWALLK
ncbi:unnamed protein product, partial [Discosporangium mesarthrocarpum]